MFDKLRRAGGRIQIVTFVVGLKPFKSNMNLWNMNLKSAFSQQSKGEDMTWR